MTTTNWVSWIISCECSSSDFDEISNLAEEMSNYFRANEADTTHFEWSATEDRNQIHIHERYANSAQAMSHMQAFGEHFGSRFMALLKPVSVIVYGFPNDELTSELRQLSPKFTTTFAGFNR